MLPLELVQAARAELEHPLPVRAIRDTLVLGALVSRGSPGTDQEPQP